MIIFTNTIWITFLVLFFWGCLGGVAYVKFNFLKIRFPMRTRDWILSFIYGPVFWVISFFLMIGEIIQKIEEQASDEED